MRTVGLIVAACAAALASPVALTASAGGPARGDAVVRLASCRTGADAIARSLTVDSTMRSLRSGDRMQMRFELYRRLPGRRSYRRLAGPGLGEWSSATPGVMRFRFRKPIQQLPAPATYFVKVRYRWRDSAGRTFARTARRSGLCRQPDLRADLRIALVGTPRPLGSTTSSYPVLVRNAGRGASGAFDAVVTVADRPHPATAVASLAAGELRSVQLVGPRCRPGAAGSVQLDPDNRVEESDERNNVRSFACP